MTLVLDTTSVPYMTELQLLQRADIRTVASLISDNGTAVGTSPGQPIPLPSALVGNANLLAALTSASGDLEAVCLIGARYMAADLTQISQAANTGAQGKMFMVLTRMTVLLLYDRRMDWKPPEELKKRVDEDKLALRNGEEMFGDTAHEQAGLVQSRKQCDPRVVRTARRFFGRTVGRGPWWGGGGPSCD